MRTYKHYTAALLTHTHPHTHTHTQSHLPAAPLLLTASIASGFPLARASCCLVVCFCPRSVSMCMSDLLHVPLVCLHLHIVALPLASARANVSTVLPWWKVARSHFRALSPLSQPRFFCFCFSTFLLFGALIQIVTAKNIYARSISVLIPPSLDLTLTSLHLTPGHHGKK